MARPPVVGGQRHRHPLRGLEDDLQVAEIAVPALAHPGAGGSHEARRGVFVQFDWTESPFL